MKKRKLDQCLPTVVRESVLGWLGTQEVGRWRSTCHAYKKDLAAFVKIHFEPQIYILNRVESVRIGKRFKKFEHLPNLKEITCCGSGFTDEVLAAASRCPKLETIKIVNGADLTDAGIAHLSSLTNLKVFHLGNAPGLTDAAFAQLPPLREFFMWRCKKITRVGIANILALNSLTTLDLGTNNGSAENVDQLVKLHNLRHLSFLGNWLSNTDFEKIATLCGLASLELAWCQSVTSDGLQHVAKLLNLEKLVLTQMELTNDNLASFAQCSRLQILSLSPCRAVTDAGLEHLSQLSNLESLSLDDCSITDAGLRHLGNLDSLRELNLRWCDNITVVGLNHVDHVEKVQVTHCLNVPDFIINC